MRIEHLQYLVEVADTGSISTAAERLHISQPNISKALAVLEEELHTEIFKRTRTGVTPTEAGRLIIEQAREILLQIDKLKKIGQPTSSTIAGSLTFGAIPSFSMSFLPSALARFSGKFPRVNIEIIDAGSLRIQEEVREGKIDFGLMALFDSAELDEKLVFEPLLSGKCMVCVSKHSVLASKKHISLQELIGYPIITFSEEYRMTSFVLNFLNHYGKPRLIITSGSAEGVKKFIAEGLAIGFYSELALKTDPYVLSGAIVPIHISNPETDSYFGIIHRKDLKLTVPVMELFKELRAQARAFCREHQLPDLQVS